MPKRDIDDVRKSAGDSYDYWFRAVNMAYINRLGIGADDSGDAPWAEYYDSDMSPLDAMAHALTDWQDDGGLLDIGGIPGLAGRV